MGNEPESNGAYEEQRADAMEKRKKRRRRMRRRRALKGNAFIGSTIPNSSVRLAASSLSRSASIPCPSIHALARAGSGTSWALTEEVMQPVHAKYLDR